MNTLSPQTEIQPIDRPPATGLARELQRLPVRVGPSPWQGWEYVRGFGVYALPFSSGHVLCLRCFPENDFAPYVTVWHRTPEGEWTIFYDAPRPDISCPRYYGPATCEARPAHIKVTWIAPMTLRVVIDDPVLEWIVSVKNTPLLRILNGISARLPLATWRPPALVHLREWIARRLLGMGDVTLIGTMPSGHHGILMPARIYFVSESAAVFDGVDLGAPTRTAENPRIGDLGLPARPAFAVGCGFWEILDHEGYRRTIEEVRPVELPLPTPTTPMPRIAP